MTDRTKWADLGFLPVSVGYVPDKESWKAQMRQMGLSTPYLISDANCTQFKNDSATPRHVILLTMSSACKRYTMAQVTGLLAHECMHAWRHIREEIGEQDPSSEFEAYVMQALVQFAVNAHVDTRKTPWRQP